VAFSPDGSRFLTVSRKVVRIWEITAIPSIPTDRLVEHACSHLTSNLNPDDWLLYYSDEPYRPICENLPVP
jgi:hypothetical protein